MKVGENGRYFKIGGEPFFPVGHNIVWPFPEIGDGNAQHKAALRNDRQTPPSHYVRYLQLMDSLKLSGGNYFRFINSPWATDIEFEKLNNYYDRQSHAWEMDRILDHADSLGLRIHFDCLIQYNFGMPDAASTYWDWPKWGDPFTNIPNFTANDSGYCYRRELDLDSSRLFFTDANAIKYYQYKLRYMIARWGYSNEIAVIELLSEVSNIPTYGYYSTSPFALNSTFRTYTDDPFNGICNEIYHWHEIMAKYIKVTLGHTDHPIAVSYGPKINFEAGDSTYNSPYIDICAWNQYQPGVGKYEGQFPYIDSLSGTLHKPIMNSEYGTDESFDCDNGVQFRKALILTPFLGLAGTGMNWDFQRTGETTYWPAMGPVNDLMSGIKLDEENWRAMTPIVSQNKAVEILYLRNFVDDNYRAVGAVSNRTYNYYTQAVGSLCDSIIPGSELDQHPIYQNMTAYVSTVASQLLHIPAMGEEVEYKINWYNALNGSFIETVHETSTSTGVLPIHFPFLSGNASKPILFFEIYRADQSTFKTAIQDISEVDDKVILPMNQKDTTPSITILTNWDENIDTNGSGLYQTDLVHIYPNPSNDNLSIQCNPECVGTEWQLRDASGKIMESGYIISPNFSINLNAYANGLYYFYVVTKSQTYVRQVIKQ